MNLIRRRELWFPVFVGPFALGLLVFVYIPILWSVWLSLYGAHQTLTPTRSVGLDSYTQLLGDPLFRDSLLVFAAFTVFIVPLTCVYSLGLALLLNGLRWGQAFFRSAFFLPTVVSYVVAALVWRFGFFSGTRPGLLNSLTRAFDEESVNWLGGGDSPCWITLVTVRLWLQTGFYMILFIVALQYIPPEIYGAAALGGAHGWWILRHITLPQLRSTSAAVIMLLLVDAFQALDKFYNMLSSPSSYSSYGHPSLVHLYPITLGNKRQDLGVGGAGTMILVSIIVVFGLLQNWVLGRQRGRSPPGSSQRCVTEWPRRCLCSSYCRST